MFRMHESRAGFWTAASLSAVVPFAAMMSVASITVSPIDIPHGGIVSGTVTLSAEAATVTSVSLTSSKPTVATVSSIASVRSGSTSTGFKVSAVAGAIGCTNISARQGVTAAKQVLVYVLPPTSPESNLRLSLSKTSAVSGTSLTGSVIATASTTSGTTVRLSSDNPTVTVPASATFQAVEGGIYVANFPITTAAGGVNTCAVITATQGTSRSRALLKLFTISG